MNERITNLARILEDYGIGSTGAHALAMYVVEGIQPGGFLSAVLANDLFEAAARADGSNQKILPQWVRAVFNAVPGRAWGSRDAVQAWVKQGGLAGQEALHA